MQQNSCCLLYINTLSNTHMDSHRPSKLDTQNLCRNGYKGKRKMSINTEKQNLEEQLYIGQPSMGRWKLPSYSLKQKQVCNFQNKPLTDVSGLPIFIQLHWCLLHLLFKNRFKLAIILQWAKCILQHITSNYTQVHYGTTT